MIVAELAFARAAQVGEDDFIVFFATLTGVLAYAYGNYQARSENGQQLTAESGVFVRA